MSFFVFFAKFVCELFDIFDGSLGPWVPQRLDPLDPIAGPDCPLLALLPRATATRTPWLTFASFLGRKQGANTCNGAMGTDTM